MNYDDWKNDNASTARQYAAEYRSQGKQIDLRMTDLSGADLSEAGLSRADLSEADLSEANLRGADLRRANLSDAIGPFTIGSFGRHMAIAAGGYISIGCKRLTYDKWLEQYEGIGRRNGYTDEEIADYGAWIQLAVARQRRIEGATN